jgi:DNA repair exonuclease SbcCD ATPase subunit
MATVQMDMAELDALREQIKTQQKEIDEQKKELYEVRADKRVLKVTDYVAANPLLTVDLGALNQVVKKQPYGIVLVRSIRRGGGSYTDMIEYELSRAIRIESIRDVERPNKNEYVNFDDVKEELRKDFEEQYADELGKLRAFKADELSRQSELETRHQNEIKKIRKEHEDYVNKLQEDRNNAYNELDKKYQELLTGKKEQSEKEALMERIKELEEKLKKKSWFNF